MPNPPAITQDNGETTGFVVTSLFSSAINLEELHAWCHHIIRQHEASELPSYIWELCDFEGPLAQIFKVIGFATGWERDEEDEAALCGIAMSRGAQAYEWPFTAEQALGALKNRPQIAERFAKTFPFIEFATGE